MTPDRLRFLEDLDSNFSVQAAAGTGKTTALVERIARIARERPEALGKLVVVTYTHRAADEMRQRLRDQLLKMTPGSDGGLLWQGLSRLFIGTIHGFCLRLIGEYGLWLGYGTSIRAASEDDPELERDFERSRKAEETGKEPAWLARVHRVIPARDISAMARQLRARTVDWSALAANQGADNDAALAALRLDPALLEGVGSSNAKARDAIARWRGHWEELAERWNADDGRFVGVPLYDGTGGKELAQRWPESLVPWADVLLRAALRAAIVEAAAFQEFRLRSGRLYFSDQIVLAHRLLGNPDLRARLLAQDFHVLLDEAQDTDPLQFELLAELSRPPESQPFAWPRDKSAAGPRAGRFIMVGDAQQAIYRDRATIEVYRRYHEALGAQTHGGILTFAETFRCRPGVAAFVNHRFGKILTGAEGQAEFVPLRAAAEDDPGRVVRWTRPQAVGSNPQKMYREAQWLAQRLRELGPSGLRARSWDEVAILSPAREWLNAVHHALKAAGVPSVLHFDRPQAHQPEYLWFTALMTVHVEPNNEFEIAGVLRELYGISDDAIYRYRYRDGIAKPRPLRLAAFPGSTDAIEQLLDRWQQCRTEAETLPLADAVALWIERTALRERLAALPATGTAGGAAKGLDRLLLQAHAAQLDGKNLREFQRGLLLGIDRPGTDLQEPGEPQVQLMTMKKAKGLQWDAVILPFLGHVNLQGGKAEYPKIVCPIGIGSGLGKTAEGLPIEIALAGSFHSEQFPARREEDEAENLRERGRLFYVACTRARYTLVLIDDAKVWERETKQGVRLSSPNGYEALRGPTEEAAPEAEGTFVNPLDLSQEYLTEELPRPVEDIPTEVSRRIVPDRWPAPVDLGTVAHRGKRLPSRHEAEEEATASARELSLQPRRTWIELGANESLAYGVWWHEALRRWPWQSEGKALLNFIAEVLLELPEGPQRERGTRELESFRHSAVCRQLAALPASRRLQEIPYTRTLGPLAHDAVEDGQIDLLYQEEAGDWVLLDWKTDALDPADYQARLREKYGSQLAAYREAVSAFGLPVKRCRIYSTVLGADVILS